MQWADWSGRAGSKKAEKRKAGRAKSIKLYRILLYSIYAAYRRIQVTELQKSLGKTSVAATRIKIAESKQNIKIVFTPF